jgi:hypothetical protein
MSSSNAMRGMATASLLALMFWLPPQDTAAQVQIRGHAGAAVSSVLARDNVASPAVRQIVRGVEEEVLLLVAPAPALGVGVRTSLRPRLVLDADVDVAVSELRVSGSEGERGLQSIAVVEVGAAVSRLVRPRVEVGGGAGVTAYVTAREGLFRDGSRIAPLLSARLSWTPPVAGDRIALVARGQVHRFGTPAIREAGGTDGTVRRAAIQMRIRLKELGQ